MKTSMRWSGFKRVVVACLLLGPWVGGCEAAAPEGAACEQDEALAQFDEHNALVAVSVPSASKMLDLKDGCDTVGDVTTVRISVSTDDAASEEVLFEGPPDDNTARTVHLVWPEGHTYRLHVRLYDSAGDLIVEGQWPADLPTGVLASAIWAWGSDAAGRSPFLPHTFYSFAPPAVPGCSEDDSCCKLWIGMAPQDLHEPSECNDLTTLDLQMPQGQTEEEAARLVKDALAPFCGYSYEVLGQETDASSPANTHDGQLVITFHEPGYLLGAIDRLWPLVEDGKFVGVGTQTCLR